MNVVLTVWALATIAMMGRGIDDFVNIVASIRWLKDQDGQVTTDCADLPFIIVLLPVLREQRVITQTLQIFTDLNYPRERLHIFVITTEKELAQRQEAKTRLFSLATDIASKRYPPSFLLEKYLGLFSEDALTEILAATQDKTGEQEILQYLLEAFHAYPTTIKLVKAYIDRINQQVDVPLFTHLHYPGIQGDVNQQLEYALKQLPLYLKTEDHAEIPSYLVVYNADSRPQPDTLRLMARMCNDYYHQNGSYPIALQQSAVFLENIGHLGSRLFGPFLQAAALLQTRWVFSHEIPRLRRQSRSALQCRGGKLNILQRIIGAEFALCVGHGFFLRYDVAQHLDLFSLSDIADDFLWSFRLCIDHIPILPIPLLESAESPTTVKALVQQKRSWFLGYTEYFRCRLAALQSGLFDRTSVESVTFHALFRASTWLLLSPTIFLAFVLPIFFHSWVMFFITAVSYGIYGILTYWKIMKELEILRKRSGGAWNPLDLSEARKIILLFVSLFAFLTESVGLWWSLYQRLYWTIAHKPPLKHKTER